MNNHFIWDIQSPAKIQQPVIVTDQVMDLRACWIIRLQYPGQHIQFSRNREAHVGCSALGSVAQYAIAAVAAAVRCRPQYNRAKAFGTERGGPLGDMTLDPATPVMRDQQNRLRLSSKRLPTRQIQSTTRLRHWIGTLKLTDERVIAGMQLIELTHVTFDQVLFGGAERLSADMRDKYTRHGHVTPPEVARTDAEIILLAVALGEQILTQQARIVQTVPLDVYAEPDRGRNVHHTSWIRNPRQGIQSDRLIKIRYCVGTFNARITQEGCVIGQRRGAADVGRRIGCLTERREPAWWYERVAVQQHHIAFGIVPHAHVCCRREAQVCRHGE